MMPPWMIEKLREEEEAQRKRDQQSWDRMLRIDLDDPFIRPPDTTPKDEPEGGVTTIVF